jgi:hypothetical protein
MGRLLDVAAAITAVAAGLYLLQFSSPGASSWFEVIGHGMGAYFIAKGVFILRSTHLAARAADRLDDLATWAAEDRGVETAKGMLGEHVQRPAS